MTKEVVMLKFQSQLRCLHKPTLGYLYMKNRNGKTMTQSWAWTKKWLILESS